MEDHQHNTSNERVHEQHHSHAHNHNHSHSKSHAHDHGGNIKIAFWLNLSFTVIELIGGILTNSMAILSDALHDFGDSFSLGLAWYLEGFSSKGPDHKFSFGYARFSLLGALVNSMILVGGSAIILMNTIPRILNPQEVNPKGMLALAVLGIIMNGLAVLRVRKGHSLNERVVSWHLLEDVLGWGVILIGSIILLFKDWYIIDPILSVLITLYILYNVIKNLREILNVFLQGVPGEFSVSEIENEIIEKTGVVDVYHTHIWSLEGENHMISTHIIVRNDITASEMIDTKENIRALLGEKEIHHATIEVDFESEGMKDYTH